MSELRPATVGIGYRRVHFWTPSGSRSFLVHRLVLGAFVGPCPAGMECRHLNGDSTDNRVENLAWGTHVENVKDVIAHGNNPMINKTHCVHGHEFTRTYRGQRRCRECDTQRQRGQRQRRRARMGAA